MFGVLGPGPGVEGSTREPIPRRSRLYPSPSLDRPVKPSSRRVHTALSASLPPPPRRALTSRRGGAYGGCGERRAARPCSAPQRPRPEVASSALQRQSPDARSSKEGERERENERERGRHGGSARLPLRTAERAQGLWRRPATSLPPPAPRLLALPLPPAPLLLVVACVPQRQREPARQGSAGPDCPPAGRPSSPLPGAAGAAWTRSPWLDHGEHPEELSAPSRVQVSWARAWAWGRSGAGGDRRQQPFHLLSDPLLQDARGQLPGSQDRGKRRRPGRGPGKSGGPRPRLGSGGPAARALSGRRPSAGAVEGGSRRRAAVTPAPWLCRPGSFVLGNSTRVRGRGLLGSFSGTLERSAFRVLALSQRGTLEEARM